MTTTALAAVVAERRRVQESLSLLESAVDSAVEGILILKPDGNRGMPRITFVNGGFTGITGLAAPRRARRDPLGAARSSRTISEAAAALRRALYAGAAFRPRRDADAARRRLGVHVRAAAHGRPRGRAAADRTGSASCAT